MHFLLAAGLRVSSALIFSFWKPPETTSDLCFSDMATYFLETNNGNRWTSARVTAQSQVYYSIIRAAPRMATVRVAPVTLAMAFGWKTTALPTPERSHTKMWSPECVEHCKVCPPPRGSQITGTNISWKKFLKPDMHWGERSTHPTHIRQQIKPKRIRNLSIKRKLNIRHKYGCMSQ